MSDSEKLEVLARAVAKVIEGHNKAAAEIEPGFSCGCKIVCWPLLDALDQIGIEDVKRIKR